MFSLPHERKILLQYARIVPAEIFATVVADAQNDIAAYTAAGDTDSASNVQARIDYVTNLVNKFNN
jgi:hypothetical protein